MGDKDLGESAGGVVASGVKHVPMVRDFSRVVLTLNNVLIPEERLSPTPSSLDGLPQETEMDLKILGTELIQTAGILLDLPQVAMATAQVLFQRFYYCKSFVKHAMDVVAMACTHLASKIEEAPRRIRDVIGVMHHIKQVRNQRTISSLVLDQNYIVLKNQVIKEERRVLKELGFCVHVKHPHKMIVMYLQVLEAERNRRLVQCAWNYMNDSFRSNVFVRFDPETIACSCIYLAARQLQIALPNNPPWYALFGVDEASIKQICLSILRLYTRPKPNADELERTVNELKLQLKLKAKASAAPPPGGSTPTLASNPGTPDKHHHHRTTTAPPSASGGTGGQRDGGGMKRASSGVELGGGASKKYKSDDNDKYDSRSWKAGDKRSLKRSRSPVIRSLLEDARLQRDTKRSRAGDNVGGRGSDSLGGRDRGSAAATAAKSNGSSSRSADSPPPVYSPKHASSRGSQGASGGAGGHRSRDHYRPHDRHMSDRHGGGSRGVSGSGSRGVSASSGREREEVRSEGKAGSSLSKADSRAELKDRGASGGSAALPKGDLKGEELGRSKKDDWRGKEERGRGGKDEGGRGGKEEQGRVREDVGRVKEDVGRVKEEVGRFKDEVGRVKEEVGRVKDDWRRSKEDTRSRDEGGKDEDRRGEERKDGARGVEEERRHREGEGDEGQGRRRDATRAERKLKKHLNGRDGNRVRR